MKKIFVILFFTMPIGLFAQNFPVVTGDIGNITDFRNKIWYQYVGMDYEHITVPFFNNFVEKEITNNAMTLRGTQYEAVCQKLFDQHNAANNRGDIGGDSRVVIVCDDTYGIIVYWWNDISSFGNFQSTGNKVMIFRFFKLKER